MRHLRFGIVIAVANLGLWLLMFVPRLSAVWPDAKGAIPIFGVTAALLLLALVIAATSTYAPEESTRGRDVTALVACTAALLIAGVVFRGADPIAAALVLLLGTGAVMLAVIGGEQLRDAKAIELSSHWGGLGGALGGWRLSPVTATVLLALIFLGATVAAGIAHEVDGERTVPAQTRDPPEDKPEVADANGQAPK
jgi:hypothetical protein